VNLSNLVKDVGGWALYESGPSWIPRLSRAQQIGLANLLGDAVRGASAEDVARMSAEIEATVGDEPFDEPLAQIVSRAYRLRMMNEIEVLRYPKLDRRTLQGTVFVEHRDYLDDAVSHGKGTIVLSGHFGAHGLLLAALGHSGFSVHRLSVPVGTDPDSPEGRTNPLLARVRAKRASFDEALPASPIDALGFLRPAYQVLARNEVLALTFDGGEGRRSVPMTLARRTAMVSSQPWQLARSTGARIVPAAVVRQHGQHLHRVFLGKPIVVAHTKDRDADLAAAAETYGAWFTKWLRKRPDHYGPYLLFRRKLQDGGGRPMFTG
jgi:KDO2-lipid IV(A) lauroyltransferase